MKPKQYLKKERELHKFQCLQNKQNYIIFHSPIAKCALLLLEETDISKRDSILKIIHGQITGSLNSKSICQNQKQLIQALQEVSALGIQRFRGRRDLRIFNGNIHVLKLHHIENINFNNLKILFFHDCSLNNIEALAHLDMINLKQIKVTLNHIVSLKPFSKTSFKQLTYLSLAYNNLSYHSLGYLARSHSPRLRFINLHEYLKEENKTKQLNLKVLNKIQIDPKRQFITGQKITILYNRQIQIWVQDKWRSRNNQNSFIYIK